MLKHATRYGAHVKVLALVTFGIATLAGCASRRELEIKQWQARPGPSLPSVEVREFELGPGDEVEVFVWEHDDLTRRSKITRRGFLPYPLIGDFRVTGMTAQQLRDHIQEGLAEYIRDPKVSVSIVAVRSQKVYVFGEVEKPGVYTLDSATTTTVVEAIGQAGGMTDDAKRKEVLLIRGDPEKVYIRPVNFDALVEDGDLRENVRLTLDDIIYVPPSTMASLARSARHIVEILSPVLALQQMFFNFQTSTLIWDQFIDVLIRGKTPTREVQTTITIIGGGQP